jgi:hypothetical protein
MKNNIIATVDFCMYGMFVVVALVGGITLTTGNVVHGTIILVAGWIISCLISGVWFTLSKMVDNTEQTNILLKKLLVKE